MVKQVNIGVIGIQGAVTEHIKATKLALKNKNIEGKVLQIKNRDEIKKINGLIIPGGESTTISRILYSKGLYQEILKRIQKKDLSIMGTCAGCVVLAKKLSNSSKKIKLLKLVDIKVQRNYFGRQKLSFEKNISVDGFEEPYNAIFIRAPLIEEVWGECKILAKIKKKIIMVRQEKILALSFHPELTNDLRIHEYFIDMVLSFHNGH